MRVATRRLRGPPCACSATFCRRKRASLNDELKWFASQLGPVRDLDVQMERMRDSARPSWAFSDALSQPYAAGSTYSASTRAHNSAGV